MSVSIESALTTLQARGINLDEFWLHAKPIDSNASVALAGSFAEGFSTPSSDIDLLIVHPPSARLKHWERCNDGTGEIFDYAQGGHSIFPMRSSMIINHRLSTGHKLQLNVTRTDVISSLQEDLSARIENAKSRIEQKTGSHIRPRYLLPYSEQKLLHRTYTGIALHGHEQLTEIKAYIPSHYLADLAGITHASLLLSTLSDLEGICQNTPEDYHTKQHLLTKTLTSLTGVLIAACGETNVGEKFFFRLLEKNSHRLPTTIYNQILDYHAHVTTLARKDPLIIKEFIYLALSNLPSKGSILDLEVSSWIHEGGTSPLILRKKEV